MKPVSSAQRYWGLDAMRGAAAAVVVIGHLVPRFAASSYLAVDFFFQLSGFVIAGAYGGRLAAGMGFQRFLTARVRRLYPLYVVGLLIGLGQIIFLMWRHYIAAHPSDVLISAFFNSVCLPSPARFFIPNALQGLFPINGPAWSMFWEMAVNIAFALLIVRLPSRVLTVIIGACALILAGVVWHSKSLNVGWEWPTWFGGVPRVLFGFTLGVLIRRLWDKPATPRWFSLLLFLPLVTCLVLASHGVIREIYDLTFCCFISPLILIGGATWDLPRKLKPIGAWLGYASYPIYIMHRGLVGLFKPVAEHFGLSDVISVIIFVPAVGLAATLVSLAIDALSPSGPRAKQSSLAEAVSVSSVS